MKKQFDTDNLYSTDTVSYTTFGYTLSVIGGKWKLPIIYALYHYKVMRFNEIKRFLGSVTYKVLSTQLKEMEQDGLLTRIEYPQVPPKVEYTLTESGKELFPIIELMCLWGMRQLCPDIFTMSTGSLKLGKKTFTIADTPDD